MPQLPPLAVQSAAWKDTDRLARFIANVIGGHVVVVGATTYCVNLLMESSINFSSLQSQSYALVQRAVVRVLGALPPQPCWSASDAEDCWNFFQWLDEYVTGDMMKDPHVMLRRSAVLAAILLAVAMVRKYKSIGWFCALQIVVIVQWVVALYQMLRIVVSMAAYFAVKALKFTRSITKSMYVHLFGVTAKHAEALRQLMKTTKSYKEWFHMATYLDVLENKQHWKTTVTKEDLEHCDFYQLKQNMAILKAAIEHNDIAELKYIVAAGVMRNKLGIDSASLHLECNSGTKQVIEHYHERVMESMELLADADPADLTTEDKVSMFKSMKQSFGSTALCLSGGGSIAMYHMGVIRALLDADLLPNVISGSSGGSITAAFTACKTNAELLNDVLHEKISTQYFPLGIWWFPPLLDQLIHCVKTGFLVEGAMFERTTRHYFGEPMHAPEKMMHYTFLDAFRKTGRHVCITVSASDITGHKGPKKLLLSHITSPHVLLWSAVAVSCSLPGIMKGKQLMARDFNGNIVPFVSPGKEWVDGSIQHDLPMETMASCFNVTNFIVSQVNPHVVPFVSDDIDSPKFRYSLFHTLESVIAADVRHRLRMLAFLGLFPKIYGHQFSGYFKQNFSGNVTIIPDFVFLESIGIKAILNPTVKDMRRYIEGGQRAVWPKLAYIRHLCEIEKCVDKILERLLGPGTSHYQNWLHPKSVEKE